MVLQHCMSGFLIRKDNNMSKHSKRKRLKIGPNQVNKSKTREYWTWTHMKYRCLCKNNPVYKYYGGRGITICPEWLIFENFYNDMGDKPKNKSLDRIDNNKGYYKDNCKWSTPKEQQNNKRNNNPLIYDGRSQSMKKWAKELDVSYRTLRGRKARGWSDKKTIETPYKRNR